MTLPWHSGSGEGHPGPTVGSKGHHSPCPSNHEKPLRTCQEPQGPLSSAADPVAALLTGVDQGVPGWRGSLQ